MNTRIKMWWTHGVQPFIDNIYVILQGYFGLMYNQFKDRSSQLTVIYDLLSVG